MSVVDYPDWQRTEQWIGLPLFNGVVNGVTNGTLFGPYPVGQWEAIAFQIYITSGTPDRFSVVVGFYDAPAGNLVSNTTYHVAQGTFTNLFVDTVPVQANFMTFTIFDLTGARNFQFTVVPRRGNNPMNRMWNGSPLLLVPQTPIAAAASASVSLSPVMACRGTWAIWSDATAWGASLNQLDVTGAAVGIIGFQGNSLGRSAQAVQIDLPPSTVSFAFSNIDAVGRNFAASFIALRT